MALADALERLGDDAELRATLGRAGRARQAAEFSAEQSARQLIPLFLGAKDTAHPVPSAAPEATALILLDRWPLVESPESTLPGLPATRWVGLGTGLTAPGIEYLPDAFVLETWWRVFPREAHQIEGWRGALGGGCSTEDYLLAAKRALYLHLSWQRGRPPLRRLHAVGYQAVLCGWMLIKLGSADAGSLFLGGDAKVTGAMLRRVAPAFTGGWIVGERKLAADLGPAFRCEAPTWEEWLRALASDGEPLSDSPLS